MSEHDPWRAPTPGAPPQVGASPPQYAPPQYAYAPYGPPPGFQQPLPKRGSIKRLVWFLVLAAVVILGGCGVGIYFLVGTVTENADAVNAFLKDVRARQYTAAYDRLCPEAQSVEPYARFSSNLQRAVADGRGVTGYDITSANTESNNGLTTRTAGGEVTFADGTSRDIVFTLGKVNGKLCIASGQALLS